MLISWKEVQKCLQDAGITLSGVLHVGAHECEEASVYQNLGIPDKRVIWIDALQDKVDKAVSRGVPNVFQAVMSDKDGEEVTFKRTNNDQSSSILEFGTHAKHYTWCVVTNRIIMKTTTIDVFMKERELDPANYDLWNFDVQGAELKALKGGEASLQHVKALYLEVNTEEVYKECAQIGEIDSYLAPFGFKRVITRLVSEGWGDALYIKTQV